MSTSKASSRGPGKPKKKSGSKSNNTGEQRTTGYRVIWESSPSGMGCYYGQDLDDDYIEACTTTKVVGEYDAMDEAEAKALKERRSTCQFDDWGEEYYGDDPPPYNSCHGDNPDEDEYVSIYIVDIAKELAEKERALEKARTSAPPKKKAKKGAGGGVGSKAPRVFGPAKGNFKPDTNIFLRNPCRVAGGESHHPNDYGTGSGKSSFAYLIQRLSDRNYTMRDLCLDEGGARYTSFKQSNIVTRCVAWIPMTNLNDHASDESILDACHIDLVDPKNGKCLLTPNNLLAAAKPQIRCMFLNNYQDCSRTKKKVDPQDIVRAINACPNLQCVSLNECAVSNEVLQALASCADLRGVILSQLQNKPREKGSSSTVATDEGLASIFRACPKLSWIYADTALFGTASWRALADGACPSLEVLWVDSTKSRNGRFGIARGDHSIIRSALSRPQRASTLKLCVVNPDEKLKSRYVIGGSKKTDRLEGDKIKTPKFDEDYLCLY